MKIPFKQIEGFVKSPPVNMRVILIYGPDSGLMKERAKLIGGSVVPDLNDPFNVVTLSNAILADDPARLSDEANAMSMMGGRRLIRVEEASDKLTVLLKDSGRNARRKINNNFLRCGGNHESRMLYRNNNAF